jgi:hypothetical protein
MSKRLLSSVVTVLATLGLMAGVLFGVGTWRNSEDTKWCQRAVMGGTLSGDPQLTAPDLVREQQSACAEQRKRQRMMFGSLWRKGGTAMAQCGFELARLQLLSPYPEARRAITARYGIDDPDFGGGSLHEQDRFIRACVANDRAGVG